MHSTSWQPPLVDEAMNMINRHQPNPSALPPLALDASGVAKSFGGIHALRDARLAVRRGEVHALLGENGSGKSTLSNIVAGRLHADEGTLLKDGVPLRVSRPSDAWKHGIALVAQDVQLNKHTTVAENMAMGRWPGTPFRIARKQMNDLCRATLDLIGADIDPRRTAGELRTDQAQLVNIARGLLSNPDLLLLDEPTTALNVTQSRRVFDHLRHLKSTGVGIVLVSHRMAEVFDLCDRASVLRDGVHRRTVDIGSTSESELIRLMVGRDLLEWKSSGRGRGGNVLEVEGLNRGILRNVSFEVRAGEVLGVGGLAGSGRSALARTLAGLRPGGTGSVRVRGEAVALSTPLDSLRSGIALLPEDRKRSAIIASKSVLDNITLGRLFELGPLSVIRKSREQALAHEKADSLRIRASSLDVLVLSLSGGNQQKVAFAKCLMSNPKVLILDEPTQGIDVGAKREIYEIIDDLAKAGVAIIVISSDMPELLAVSDRIVAMRRGQIVGELQRHEASEESLLHLIIEKEGPREPQEVTG
ncbi:MAG: sugar ABC transporter ATP-binding protein [Pseudolysinimonas sp.]|uniref:sugar ABC transporter ATP-binding protein n=1 Tax=Pseudolysinimonas sp. TaxID=2680009 RepID=UPI003C76A919